MSGESKSREVVGTTRLFIPTPSQGLVRCESDDTSALLRIYYSNYQRLKKEQSTLTNQLAIIEREREELRERLEAMRVRMWGFSESRRRSGSGTGGRRERSTGTSCVRWATASASTGRRGRCCSTSRSNTATSITPRSMRPWCCPSTRRIRNGSSPTPSTTTPPSDHSRSCTHSHTHPTSANNQPSPFHRCPADGRERRGRLFGIAYLTVISWRAWRR
jgi:hypothetical protein